MEIRTSSESRTCFVTGSGGYLGGQFKAALQRRGWKVNGLVRSPAPDSGEVRFQLGEPMTANLADAHGLVHCAYDFKPLSWRDMHRVNVLGTQNLFQAAHAAGVRNLVFISSMSAHEGCHSLYGRAKLEIEKIARLFGAIVVRPGFVYGDMSSGLFGRLVRQVERAQVLPLVGGGSQLQYMAHDQDLSDFVCRCIAGEVPVSAEPITVAHPQPWTFRQILETIARAQGRRISFFPIPWRFVWVTMKLAECSGLRLSFRSDSLVSLMYQNPNPSFAAMQALGIECRPFRVTPNMVQGTPDR